MDACLPKNVEEAKHNQVLSWGHQLAGNWQIMALEDQNKQNPGSLIMIFSDCSFRRKDVALEMTIVHWWGGQKEQEQS